MAESATFSFLIPERLMDNYWCSNFDFSSTLNWEVDTSVGCDKVRMGGVASISAEDDWETPNT